MDFGIRSNNKRLMSLCRQTKVPPGEKVDDDLTPVCMQDSPMHSTSHESCEGDRWTWSGDFV